MAEFLNNADPVLGLPALVLLVLGLICLLMAVIHLRKRRVFLSMTRGLVAVLLFGGAVALLLLAINLYTYQRLTYEKPVAELVFRKTGPQRYEARISTPRDRTGSVYRLSGDEWQLDARVLKWKPPANLLGLDARYRLERLSGRYRDLDQQREERLTAYGLATNQGLDLWSVIGRLKEYVDWVDTYYGSATYLPMANNARYEVVVTQSGLTARPLNEAAEQAVRGW